MSAFPNAAARLHLIEPPDDWEMGGPLFGSMSSVCVGIDGGPLATIYGDFGCLGDPVPVAAEIISRFNQHSDLREALYALMWAVSLADAKGVRAPRDSHEALMLDAAMIRAAEVYYASKTEGGE